MTAGDDRVVARNRRMARAVTIELLDHMERLGYRPALLAFVDADEHVYIATAPDIELRIFITRLARLAFDQKFPDERVQLLGS